METTLENMSAGPKKHLLGQKGLWVVPPQVQQLWKNAKSECVQPSAIQKAQRPGAANISHHSQPTPKFPADHADRKMQAEDGHAAVGAKKAQLARLVDGNLD